MARKTQVRLQWRFLFRVVVIVAVLVAAVSVSAMTLRSLRQQQREMYLRHRALKIRAATYGMEDRLGGSLPARVYLDDAGRLLFSWRFVLLATLDEYCPIRDSTKPWSDPVNEEAVAIGNMFFCLPYLSDKTSPANEDCHGNTAVVTGPGTAFEDGKHYRYQELPLRLILVVEVADSGGHWAEPGDLDIRDLPTTTTEGPEGDGFLVAFVDHQVWFLRNNVPVAVLKEFMTIDTARNAKREELLGPYGQEITPLASLRVEERHQLRFLLPGTR
jgi:hypothetical protein